MHTVLLVCIIHRVQVGINVVCRKILVKLHTNFTSGKTDKTGFTHFCISFHFSKVLP